MTLARWRAYLTALYREAGVISGDPNETQEQWAGEVPL